VHIVTVKAQKRSVKEYFTHHRLLIFYPGANSQAQYEKFPTNFSLTLLLPRPGFSVTQRLEPGGRGFGGGEGGAKLGCMGF
jgi:hypothetical protein